MRLIFILIFLAGLMQGGAYATTHFLPGYSECVLRGGKDGKLIARTVSTLGSNRRFGTRLEILRHDPKSLTLVSLYSCEVPTELVDEIVITADKVVVLSKRNYSANNSGIFIYRLIPDLMLIRTISRASIVASYKQASIENVVEYEWGLTWYLGPISIQGQNLIFNFAPELDAYSSMFQNNDAPRLPKVVFGLENFSFQIQK